MTKDVLPIQEPKDPKTSETDAEIGPKGVKNSCQKVNNSNSDTKSMSESDTFKDFVNTPDTRASDGSDDESEVPITDLKINLKDEDVAEKHLVSDQDGQFIPQILTIWKKHRFQPKRFYELNVPLQWFSYCLYKGRLKRHSFTQYLLGLGNRRLSLSPGSGSSKIKAAVRSR